MAAVSILVFSRNLILGGNFSEFPDIFVMIMDQWECAHRRRCRACTVQATEIQLRLTQNNNNGHFDHFATYTTENIW